MSLALIYSSIPRANCKGKCQASCGPISGYPAEVQAFEAAGKPFPNPLIVIRSKDLTCPRLNPVGQCDNYAARPIICRLWGVVEGMPCVFGCTPDRVMSDREAGDLMRQVSEIPMIESVAAPQGRQEPA